MPRYAVTGATGQLGCLTVQELLARGEILGAAGRGKISARQDYAAADDRQAVATLLSSQCG